MTRILGRSFRLVQTGWLIRAEGEGGSVSCYLDWRCTLHAYFFPRFSRLLIALLDYWTSKLRYQILEEEEREGGGEKKKGREEFDRVAKFIARLCVKTSKKFFLKLVEGMVSDWRCWGKLNPPRKLIMVDKQDSRRYTG